MLNLAKKYLPHVITALLVVVAATLLSYGYASARPRRTPYEGNSYRSDQQKTKPASPTPQISLAPTKTVPTLVPTKTFTTSPTPSIKLIPSQPVFCTMDALLCPDGSSVGRVGPKCEFTPCPPRGI